MKPDAVERSTTASLIDLVVETWGENEREIVEHPGSVAIVAVDAQDRVILVRQLREPARKELLELPAGGLEPGEEPLACARRELREETGLHGGDWREAAAFWTTPGFCNEHMHLFLAERPGGGRAPRAPTRTSRSSSSAGPSPRSASGSARSRTRRRSPACCSSCATGSIGLVSEVGQSLKEQLEEIGARLAWVRDYL